MYYQDIYRNGDEAMVAKLIDDAATAEVSKEKVQEIIDVCLEHRVRLFAYNCAEEG